MALLTKTSLAICKRLYMHATQALGKYIFFCNSVVFVGHAAHLLRCRSLWLFKTVTTPGNECAVCSCFDEIEAVRHVWVQGLKALFTPKILKIIIGKACGLLGYVLRRPNVSHTLHQYRLPWKILQILPNCAQYSPCPRWPINPVSSEGERRCDLESQTEFSKSFVSFPPFRCLSVHSYQRKSREMWNSRTFHLWQCKFCTLAFAALIVKPLSSICRYLYKCSCKFSTARSAL